MCSPVVTIVLRASTQLAASPFDVSAAATMRLLAISPMRGDRVEPARRDVPEHAERADDAIELVELAIDEGFDLAAFGVFRDDAGDLVMPRPQRAHVLARAVDVAGARLGGDAEQPIRRAAERRHDDDRPAPVACFPAGSPPVAPRARC